MIAVLLPGVEDLPNEVQFLREFNWVRFHDIEDDDALERLIWGITGKRPS